MREPRVRLIISSTVLPFITVLSSFFCSFHSLFPLSPSPNWAPFFDLYKQVMWEAKVPHNTSQRVWLPPTLSRQCENVMEFFKLILFFPFFPWRIAGRDSRGPTRQEQQRSQPIKKTGDWLPPRGKGKKTEQTLSLQDISSPFVFLCAMVMTLTFPDPIAEPLSASSDAFPSVNSDLYLMDYRICYLLLNPWLN